MSFPPGKLPLEVLGGMLERYTDRDERVRVGAGVGEDATVISFGETCLVAKTDPITFATDDIGRYAIHVNANDIAAMGAVPRWFLATVLLPEKGTDLARIDRIFESLHRASREIGVSLCGGHTEVTVGLDRPLVIGQMLGEVKTKDLVRSSGLRVGDALLLTKGLGIEATAILALEKTQELLARGVPEKTVEAAKVYLSSPGISVLKEARVACEAARVHAMHDPTEGGISTALRELARAARVGLEIESVAMHITDETRTLCKAFDLDPLGVISSGALLIGVAAEDAEKVKAAILAEGIRCDLIGRATREELGLKIREGAQWLDLPAFDRDEIGKAFE